MTLLLTLLIMAVIGLVAAVAAGRIGGGLDDPASSLPGRGLPPGPFTLADVDRVRFSPALRGYRMDEVDDVVDRLVDELRRRDEELAALRGYPGAPGSAGTAGAVRGLGAYPQQHAAGPPGAGGAPRSWDDVFRGSNRPAAGEAPDGEHDGAHAEFRRPGPRGGDRPGER